MFTIKLAGHIFTVDNHYDYTENLCKDYLTESMGELITVSEEQIQREIADGVRLANECLESLAVYRLICERLLKEDILLFHSSAIMMDKRGYLFTAPSGTGKSTHAALWKKQFGNRVTIINDDKPLLAFHSDGIYAYGTPYSGKSDLHTNTHAKVEGIVILYQDDKNTIRPLKYTEAYPVLLNQTYRQNDAEAMKHTLNLIDRMCEVPLFSLGCTVSAEAVNLAYNALKERSTQ